jgi:hypothetical protein
MMMISVAYMKREKTRARERERDDNRYAMARQTSWKMTAAITFFYLNKIYPEVINLCFFFFFSLSLA